MLSSSEQVERSKVINKFAQEIVAAVVELEAGRMPEDDYYQLLGRAMEALSMDEGVELAQTIAALQGRKHSSPTH
jgi:hypothetical protein